MINILNFVITELLWMNPNCSRLENVPHKSQVSVFFVVNIKPFNSKT